MARQQSIKIRGAVGRFTAALALLSGPPSAMADELWDLRANQELLQRRLDQLAQTSGGPTGAQLLGGSFPRSFLIPGTDSSMRIGGEVREVLDYWFNGGPPNASPQTEVGGATGQAELIPLHLHSAAGNPARSRGDAVFSQSPRESRFNVETRTPSAWGEALTFVELSWGGSNAFVPGGNSPVLMADHGLVPRLRSAYGTLGPVLAGQAASNFADPDASAETIDFGGNFGSPGTARIPQVRYTMPLANWGLPGGLSVSAETPETDIVTGAGLLGSDAGAVTAPAGSPVAGAVIAAPVTNPAKATAPDLTMAWYMPQPWGHMDFSAVVRPGLQVKDGLFVNRTFVGSGVHLGGDVKPHWFDWEKDYITFHFVYGDGIGRYINAGSNFALVSNYPALAPPATAAAAANVLIRTTVEWGGNVGYQHRWSDTLRSTASCGINHHDIDSRVAGCAAAVPAVVTGNCSLNKELIIGHLNLIWNPVPFVDLGVEYMRAHRMVLSNIKGDENMLISKFGVRY